MKTLIRNSGLFFFILAAGFSFSGCALLLLGGGAATAGYAVSDDEVEGLTDRSLDDVYSLLEELLDEEGLITSRNATTRTLEALIQNSEVTAVAERMTAQSVRFRIKARRADGLFPDLDLAKKLVNEFYKRL